VERSLVLQRLKKAAIENEKQKVKSNKTNVSNPKTKFIGPFLFDGLILF